MSPLPERHSCQRCGVCVVFEASNPNDERESALCYCGHSFLHHAVPVILPPPRVPTMLLPPKGGCPASGCVKFEQGNNRAGPITPQSLCVCGQGWLAHVKVTPVTTSSLTPPPTPTVVGTPAMAWPLPSQVRSGTSNERRVQSYTSLRPAVGIPGTASPFSPFPTSIRPINSSSTRTSSRPVRLSSRATTRRSSVQESLRFDIVFLPYPFSPSLEIESDEPFPKDLRLTRQKLPDILRRLRHHNLVIDVTLSTSDPQRLAMNELHEHITSHLTAHSIHFPASPPFDMNVAACAPQVEYERADWLILQLGKLNRDATSYTLKPAALTTWQLTVAALIDNMNKISRNMKNPFSDTPLLFIAPRFGKLTGPIDTTNRIHSCYASRVMDTLFTAIFPEPTRNPSCLSACPSYGLEQRLNRVNDDDDDDCFNESLSSTIARGTTLQSENTAPPHPTHSNIADWQAYVQDHALDDSGTDIQPWRGQGTTVEDVADLLTAFIYSQFGGISLCMASLPPGLTIGYSYKNDGSDLSLASLFMSKRTYKVGEGLGEGVERSVLAQAVQKSTSELSTWMETMDGFKSVSTLPFGVLDPKMACKLKTHGLLCALHIFALGQPPVPMLGPEAAQALSAIPSNHNSPLDLSPTGPLASLLATYLMIQPVQLTQDMLPARRFELQQQLRAGVLLGCPSAFTLDVPQEILAFSEGFDAYVSDEIPSLASAILITELYQQHLSSPTQLIQRLEFEVAQISESDSGHARGPIIDADTEAAFILRFTRYLRGVGHPKHPAVKEYVSQEQLCADEESTTSIMLRCKQFMLQISGSCILPANPKQNFCVHFTKGLPQKYAHSKPLGAGADWEPATYPMHFQTCSYRVNIPLTKAIVSSLADPIPDDDDTVTDFDLWIHFSLFAFSGPSSFNIL
ncbi:hypothetical protein EDD22DRAFT_963250 [Suillus occidentalis]|nr:hypothetical protein EDD22DRAFT_963250 [Suillus occidentalis]